MTPPIIHHNSYKTPRHLQLPITTIITPPPDTTNYPSQQLQKQPTTSPITHHNNYKTPTTPPITYYNTNYKTPRHLQLPTTITITKKKPSTSPVTHHNKDYKTPISPLVIHPSPFQKPYHTTCNSTITQKEQQISIWHTNLLKASTPLGRAVTTSFQKLNPALSKSFSEAPGYIAKTALWVI